MYKHTLRVHGEFLAAAQSVSSTAATGNGSALRADNTQGALELVIAANGDVSIAAEKAITVTLTECDTEDGTYTTVPIYFMKTYSAATAYADGDVIGKIPLPSDIKTFVKVALSTTNTSAIGAVDVFAAYLPR
ncbi:MAG: hypothetical protein R3Y11_03905 [Pseudomonadota bacterium]